MGEKTIYICDRCGREEPQTGTISGHPPNWVSIFLGWGKIYLICDQCWKELDIFKEKP